MADGLNGAVRMPGVQVGNPMVQALEAILAKVKAGEVSTIAIIAMSTTGYYPPFMMGPQRADLGMALDFAKASLLAEVFAPPKTGLVRAPAGLDVKGG
jgi:hypothetical protein